jgi:putative SOS response-associated peptidase YedK
MCGRYTSGQPRSAIAERFHVAVPDGHSERFNMAPTQRALIVRQREDDLESVMAHWGLLPHWAKDDRIAFKMINARAETLTEKPAYRSLLGSHRCLVVADGFYEWQLGADGKKEPVYFQLTGGELFGFAGLWTSRRDDATGEAVDSCEIITTTPNELVAPVHDRMPVILPRELEGAWLDPELPKDHALELLRPYEATGMRATVASKLLNSVKNEGPELLQADLLPAA